MNEIPMKIAEKIKEDGNLKWIEEHDRLLNQSDNFILDVENQYKFWRTNCAIRYALSEIEKQLKTNKNKGIKSSVREIAWSNIARKSSCDRNTLKHILRYKWVEKSRKVLLEILNSDTTSSNITIVKSQEELLADEINLLKSELRNSKKETGKWYLKNQDALEEVTQLKKVIKRLNDISVLKDETIVVQRNQIKELMRKE